MNEPHSYGIVLLWVDRTYQTYQTLQCLTSHPAMLNEARHYSNERKLHSLCMLQ